MTPSAAILKLQGHFQILDPQQLVIPAQVTVNSLGVKGGESHRICREVATRLLPPPKGRSLRSVNSQELDLKRQLDPCGKESQVLRSLGPGAGRRGMHDNRTISRLGRCY